MRNSKEYAKKIKNLYYSLKHEYPKVQQINHETAVDALVYSLVSEKLSMKATESALKGFTEYFVDYNDMRVSRAEEITEVLGENSLAGREIASRIIRALQNVFSDYHKISLENLKKLGKRPARQVLEKIDGASRFVVDYCMLTSLHAHAIPLTEDMIKYLRNNDFVDPDADEQQISGFLTKQISAKDGYEFYVLLRQESEAPQGKKRTKTKRKTKTKEVPETKTRAKK
jgi:endonuclease III